MATKDLLLKITLDPEIHPETIKFRLMGMRGVSNVKEVAPETAELTGHDESISDVDDQ
jgi:hypothetical protein